MNEATKPLEVEYDFVAIIDGLPDTERTQHKISDRLKELIEVHGFACERADCNTKKAVVAALQHFRNRALAGAKFCLHIVCHGSENGLWIKGTDESIEWRLLRRHLLSINTAMGGTLILNMSTCGGLHGIKIVDLTGDRLPFFGLIGVSRILFPDEAIRLNERFYSMLPDGKPIQEIIREIAKDPGGEVLDCITADGYKRLSQT
jgi:hypothetical protein